MSYSLGGERTTTRAIPGIEVSLFSSSGWTLETLYFNFYLAILRLISRDDGARRTALDIHVGH